MTSVPTDRSSSAPVEPERPPPPPPSSSKPPQTDNTPGQTDRLPVPYTHPQPPPQIPAQYTPSPWRAGPVPNGAPGHFPGHFPWHPPSAPPTIPVLYPPPQRGGGSGGPKKKKRGGGGGPKITYRQEKILIDTCIAKSGFYGLQGVGITAFWKLVATAYSEQVGRSYSHTSAHRCVTKLVQLRKGELEKGETLRGDTGAEYYASLDKWIKIVEAKDKKMADARRIEGQQLAALLEQEMPNQGNSQKRLREEDSMDEDDGDDQSDDLVSEDTVVSQVARQRRSNRRPRSNARNGAVDLSSISATISELGQVMVTRLRREDERRSEAAQSGQSEARLERLKDEIVRDVDAKLEEKLEKILDKKLQAHLESIRDMLQGFMEKRQPSQVD